MGQYIKFWIAKDVAELLTAGVVFSTVVAMCFGLYGLACAYDAFARWCKR